MKKDQTIYVLAILFAILLIMAFVGCMDNDTPALPGESDSSKATSPDATSPSSEEPGVPTSELTNPADQLTEPSVIPVVIPPEEERDEYGLTEKQRNSLSMLYYLTFTAEKICISKNNRLILNDIYTSLLNDINPSAIDETTQKHLMGLCNTIEDFLNLSVKRERLQYIYNQSKAASIRSAIPNPLAILSMTKSFDWNKLALSTVYTVVDSYNNYKSASEAADKAFLTNGWTLDNEETGAIQNNRKNAFNYMLT